VFLRVNHSNSKAYAVKSVQFGCGLRHILQRKSGPGSLNRVIWLSLPSLANFIIRVEA
jgi:hypothetical protein